MNRFGYARPETVEDAVQAAAGEPAARFIAGGTNLVDLMRYNVVKPTRVIDINRLPGLRGIEDTPAGGVRIGALATNSEVAYDSRVEQRYPLLSRTILSGATAQLRNAASTGGNLLQRTRCYYFYDPVTPCNKRAPSSGCGAIGGINRIHAILGASTSCIATHPSDMCVALAALEAIVHVTGPSGERQIPFADFHRLPGETPERDTNLEPGEIVLAVELPPRGFAEHYTYLRLRDRLSYAFALVSVAVGLEMKGGRIGTARIALGGVAHKPWRVQDAEAALEGGKPGPDAFGRAAEILLQGAQGHEGNAFKIDLARRAIVRALSQAARGTPQTVADKQVR